MVYRTAGRGGAARPRRVRLVELGAVSESAPAPPAWRGPDISDFLAPPKIVRWFQTLR